MSRRASPTAKARRVAGTLREMRERVGMSASDAAKGVDHDTSWLPASNEFSSDAWARFVDAVKGGRLDG